jgi:hypothetical protein
MRFENVIGVQARAVRVATSCLQATGSEPGRQQLALIVMRIEERKLLMDMDDIDGVVNVERWRGGVAGAIEIDHDPHHADEVAQRVRILPA